MRYFALLVFMAFALFSCTEDSSETDYNSGSSAADSCNNRFLLISAEDSIPTFILNIAQNPDSTRSEIESLYDEDLCQYCRHVPVKIPVDYEGRIVNVEFLADFGHPYCDGCPIPLRERNYFTIWINEHNQIMADKRLANIDSLPLLIEKFQHKIKNDGSLPENFKRVFFRLNWSQATSKDIFHSVLTMILKGYLNFIENEILTGQTDFCQLDKSEIQQIKTTYPLQIELDLGKMNREMQILSKKLRDERSH